MDKYIWHSNGRDLYIRDMTNRHLIITIRNLRKSVTKLALQSDSNDLKPLSIDEVLEKTVPQYETMLLEAFRRGIPDSELVDTMCNDTSTLA
jgi:hypothetical protein